MVNSSIIQALNQVISQPTNQ